MGIAEDAQEDVRMRRIRVVLCVVLVIAMLAMSVGPAAAGSKPTSMLDPGLIAQEPQSGFGALAYNGGKERFG